MDDDRMGADPQRSPQPRAEDIDIASWEATLALDEDGAALSAAAVWTSDDDWSDWLDWLDAREATSPDKG